MQDRDALRTAFLRQAGWAAADLAWRPGDASFRRYARLTLDGATAMLMDAPPPREDIRPFLSVGALFAAAGLSTPTAIAADVDAGFLLLEDFGDRTFTRLLDAGANPAPLYDLATDALIQLRQAMPDRPPGLPAYTAETRVAQLSTVLDWLWPAVMDKPPSPATRATFDALWLDALKRAPGLGCGVVHRDFHVDNLMRLDDRAGVQACGVLDFQDAAWGPFAYDLASLLEDARRPLDPAIKASCILRYRAAFPEFEAQAIAAALAVHGGQRHMRVAGLWVRLWRRDGKPGYLKHMRRTWSLLETSLAHPLLADVAEFLDCALPADARQRAIQLESAAAR